ncbi:MAG: NAD(P)H-hydrate dehydratase [Oscillospiraceae bacterium]|nr:NAD(P)H-hydrate dehydratase [Oscillospiraceae bacterium]
MDQIRLTKQDVWDLLPDRPHNVHKGSVGKVLLLCGSVGYTGAPALASMGALRCGAGMVYLAVPQSIYTIEAIKLTEPVVQPLPEEDGMFCMRALKKICRMMDGMDAVLIGPGVGRSAQAQEVVRAVLTEFMGPVVLDADGIFAVSKHKDILRDRQSPVILTPHEGEFSRLMGYNPTQRVESAVAAASELGQILLLKGPETVITDGTKVFVNPTGNPGMAVGGCGDALSGMITALLGQKLSPINAAACGAWLHGAAGDICAEELGMYGMLPTDMLNVLPRLLK